MLGKLRFLAIAVALAAAFQPAGADWRYTQWGMTRDQVVAASNGNAHTAKSNSGFWDLTLGAAGTHTENSLDFVDQFYFNKSGQLKIVRIAPADQSNCVLLRLYLEGKYGEPAGVSKPSDSKLILTFDELWRDEAAGNAVRYTDIVLVLGDKALGICFAAYFPLTSLDADFKTTFE